MNISEAFDSRSLSFPRELHEPARAPRPPLPEGSPGNQRTEMCWNMVELGRCPYGDKCEFAHCTEELRTRPKPPGYRTALCKNFFKDGICYYGTRCRFSHSLSYAHALGYVYDPSISAYVRGSEILYGNTQSTLRSKVAECWSTRKTG